MIRHTYVQKLTQVLFKSTSCPTGLLYIFIYFIFDIILCFGGISLMRTLCDAYYYVHFWTYLIRQGNTNLK